MGPHENWAVDTLRSVLAPLIPNGSLRLAPTGRGQVEVSWQQDVWPLPVRETVIIYTAHFLGRGGMRKWRKDAKAMVEHVGQSLLDHIETEGEA